jgi:hypothetical protein
MRQPKHSDVGLEPSGEGVIFSRGWVGKRDLVWVLAHDDPDSGMRTRVMQYKSGRWVSRIVGWGAVALTARVEPEVEVIAVGAEGDVLVGGRAGFADERVGAGKDGPEIKGQIRDARFIGAEVFAVGMSRQVYRRGGRNRWARADVGVLASPRDQVGFNGVDGLTPDDAYAVGMKGEIFHFDGNLWQQVPSPTNVALHRVRCLPGGEVYACGAAGTLLRGSASGFAPIATEDTTANLYGLEWFSGRLYAASSRAVFVLDEGELKEVDVAGTDAATFGDLHAADGVLWSFGPRHLFFTEDGSSWTQVHLS